jgi:DNA invertase Pin-like site-specific DNA recombinase
VAEYETEVGRERQLAGIALAKAKGTVYRGRAKGQFNKRTQELLGTVCAMVDAGVSVSTIAKTVKLSRPGIDRMGHCSAFFLAGIVTSRLVPSP